MGFTRGSRANVYLLGYSRLQYVKLVLQGPYSYTISETRLPLKEVDSTYKKSSRFYLKFYPTMKIVFVISVLETFAPTPVQ